MSIKNFGELKAKVIAFTARNDLANIVSDFILSAHQRIVAELVLAHEVELDAASVSLPSDCGEVLGLTAIADAAVALRQAASREMESAGQGLPQRYRVEDGEAILAPAPDRIYSGRLLCRPSRAFFTSDTSTNTVLSRYPFLYLHGALEEFMRYDRDAAGEVSYGNRFTSGLNAALLAERRRALGGASPQTVSGVAI